MRQTEDHSILAISIIYMYIHTLNLQPNAIWPAKTYEYQLLIWPSLAQKDVEEVCFLATSCTTHFFGQPGEEVSALQEVKNEIQLALGLECCTRGKKERERKESQINVRKKTSFIPHLGVPGTLQSTIYRPILFQYDQYIQSS